MRFVWLWQLLLSVLGGVLIALGLVPWNVSWLVWGGVVPILVSLLALRGRAVLIILQGILFSGTFGLIAFHWLWKEHRYQELGTILGVFSLQGVIWGWFVLRFCKLPELAKPDEKKGKKKLEPLFIGVAGVQVAQRATQPLQLKTRLTASPGTSMSELISLLPGVATLKADLLVWQRINEGATRSNGLNRASVEPDFGIITGVASDWNSPISGYSAYLPTTVKSVISFQRYSGFQLLADQVPKNLQSFAVKDISLLALINQEAMSLQALKAGLRAPAQGFVVLVDFPKDTAIGEQQFRENLRCWGVSLGRPIIFESDRAGAVMQNATGRILAEVAPRTRLLSTHNLDFPIANDMTPYGSFCNWISIVKGAA